MFFDPPGETYLKYVNTNQAKKRKKCWDKVTLNDYWINRHLKKFLKKKKSEKRGCAKNNYVCHNNRRNLKLFIMEMKH